MKSEIVVKIIKNILKKEIRINPDDLITSLGLSSIQMVQLAVALESVCSTEINPAVMAAVVTVNDLIGLID